MTVQLSFLASSTLTFRRGTLDEANALLGPNHYLGTTTNGRYVYVAECDGAVVACQVWRLPAARMLPNDGSWLELSRWCLTPLAGANAGSRMHAFAVRDLKARDRDVTTLVSYSDPSVGHTGALYRACNWAWAPTWHRLRPPPSGNGSWSARKRESVKDRWVFHVRRDDARSLVLAVKDASIVRKMGAAP